MLPLCVCRLQALKTTYHQTSQYLEIDIGKGWGSGQRKTSMVSAGQRWETGTGRT